VKTILAGAVVKLIFHPPFKTHRGICLLAEAREVGTGIQKDFAGKMAPAAPTVGDPLP
jgi:hypothetical protein